jgi:superfamily II DNA/RNA helicase
MNFEDLGFSAPLLSAILERGYNTPTPIQAEAIPHILMLRDLIGLAQTGTGKTASFILPMIEILDGGRAKARMPRSLVLAPTRELAAQVADNFKIYGKNHNLEMALLVGGESMMDQKKMLDKGVDVLIATPGRMMDLFERGNILLNDIKILVIDEADRMLDMGFIPDIEKIVSLLPPMRQTLLFSATMAPEIDRLAQKFLNNPRMVSVAPPASPAENVQQRLVWVYEDDKKDALFQLIKQQDIKNAFLFCNRKRDVDDVAAFLKKKGLNARAMHGDMAQSVRTETLDQFKKGDIQILVCSDVAARGIDIKNVSHVFNYDAPISADDYVHRIGRTGRAGAKGDAWMLVTAHDTKQVQAIEKNMNITLIEHDLDGFQSPSQQEREQGLLPAKGRKIAKSAPKKPILAKEKTSHPPIAKPEIKAETEKNKNIYPLTHEKHTKKTDSSTTEIGFGDHLPAFMRNGT